MTSRTVTVEVPGANRQLQPQSRTLYTAPGYGPIFTSLEGVPFPWAPTTAFAMRDANADNFRVFNHFFDVDRAASAPQVLSILKKYEGIPWVNTIVSDKQGSALYADIGAIPNVSNAKAQQCDTALGTATFGSFRAWMIVISAQCRSNQLSIRKHLRIKCATRGCGVDGVFHGACSS